MGYANLTAAKALLGLDDDNEADASDIAMLASIDAAVSQAFEHKAGYDVALSPIWGEDVTADEATVTISPWRSDGRLLFLPRPARSISEIRIAGDYDQTLTADQWTGWHVTTAGDILAVRLIDGSVWPYGGGTLWVEVDAVWSDSAVGPTVPTLVTEAVTFITVDEFRMRKASPTGEIGLDGFTTRPRNPWGYELVKTALAAHGAPMPVAVF